MTSVDQYIEHYKSCVSMAQKISFALAAFSVVAIYIGVIGAAAQKSELSKFEFQRSVLKADLSQFELVLAEVREFYEGPAEAEQLNFASQIYAINNTREYVAELQGRADSYSLSPADRSFFDFQTTLIAHNAFELQNILGGLIRQKEHRVPFERLPFSDLLDLDYHKGKDAWQIYYEWSAIRYALYRESDYGYSAYPQAGASLEVRYRYFVEKGVHERGASTKPKAAGRNQRLVDLIAGFSSRGFQTLGDIRIRISDLDSRIDRAKKDINGSIKVPFLEQSIEVEELAWLVPLTIALSLLFELYYVREARAIAAELKNLDATLARAMASHPWLLLDRSLQPPLYRLLAYGLRALVVAAPIAVSAVLTASGAHRLDLTTGVGAALSFFAAFATVLVVIEVRGLEKALLGT